MTADQILANLPDAGPERVATLLAVADLAEEAGDWGRAAFWRLHQAAGAILAGWWPRMWSVTADDIGRIEVRASGAGGWLWVGGGWTALEGDGSLEECPDDVREAVEAAAAQALATVMAGAR
jgi:hypothetical protein